MATIRRVSQSVVCESCEVNGVNIDFVLERYEDLIWLSAQWDGHDIDLLYIDTDGIHLAAGLEYFDGCPFQIVDGSIVVVGERILS